MTRGLDIETPDRDSAGPRAMSRVLALLDRLAAAPEGLSLSDLSAQLATPKSTMINSLRPLVAEGFLMAEGSLYRLGPRSFRLAADIGAAWSLPRIVRGYMREVSEATRESVALAVLDVEMRRFVYIDSIESPQPVRYATRIGMSGPLYATAAGRVLLAHQDEAYREAYIGTARLAALTPRTNTDSGVLRDQLEAARTQGYWVSVGESVPDSAAVAAPIFGPSGEILAALSLGAPSDRLEAHRDSYVAAVTKAAGRASGEPVPA
jgi:IclR family transcriptional regulator, acetate operon repressor